VKNSILVLSIVLGMVFGFSGAALAGRPLCTDDAGTVGPGHVEVELGWEYAKQPNDDKENALTLSLTTGIIWDRLDLGVETPYMWLNVNEGNNVDGIGDLLVRFKLRFIDETDKFPALAVTLGGKTTTGNSKKGLGTGEVDFVANFIATKEMGRVTLHGNVGHNATGDVAEEQEFNLVNLGLAGEFSVNEQITLVSEIYAEIATEDIDEENPLDILVGATYELPIGTVLDFGVAAGLTNGSPDYRITLGMTHEF